MPTVDVPVVGNVERQYVVAAGAVVVGIVGFAYYRRSHAGPPAATTGDESVSLPEGTPPTVVDSNVDVVAPNVPPRTNAEWTTKAVEYLVTIGTDAGFAGTTLGKYLARRPLTDREQDVALAAVAGVGPPPVGGPYTITSTPVPVPAPVKPPRYLPGTHVWATDVSIRWVASQSLPSNRQSPNEVQAQLIRIVNANYTLLHGRKTVPAKHPITIP